MGDWGSQPPNKIFGFCRRFLFALDFFGVLRVAKRGGNCLKRTNTDGLKEKYYDQINIKALKEIVSNESKRKNSRKFRTAACCQA